MNRDSLSRQALTPIHPFFEMLFQSSSFQYFILNNFEHIPFAQPGSCSLQFSDWILFETINQAGNSNIKIIKDFQIVDQSSKFPLGKLRQAFDTGSSIVIRHAERSHLQLHAIAEAFRIQFGMEPDIQIFATPKSLQTFTWHYDPEEVFILQTFGKKIYTLRQNTINPKPSINSMPKDLAFEKETSKVYLDTELHSKDWIYIPKGWWHKAVAVEDSIHLSVGLS